MRRVMLVTLAAVQIGSAHAAAHDPRPDHPVAPASTLLEAHLLQAKSLAPPPESPPSHAEEKTRASAWNGRSRRSADAEPLLAGVATATISRSLRWERDPGDLKRALADRPTLAIVLATVARRSPEAQAARERWRASLRQFDQASFLEDLLVPYRAFARELDTKIGPQSHREMPEATFPFPAALSHRGLLIDIRTDIERLRYEQALRKVMNDAARSYVQVRYTVEALEELEKSRKLLAEMDAVTRAHIQVGSASDADALKSQTAVAMLANDIELLRLQRTSDIAQANAAMGLPAATSWGTPAPVELAARRSHHDGEESQEVQQARRMLDESRAMVRMAEIMVLPSAISGASLIAPSVGAEAGPTRSTMATFPERVEVTSERAPLGANAAYIDELRVRVRASQRELDAMILHHDALVTSAHVRVERATLSLTTYGDQVVPRARQTLESLQQRYTSGTTAFLEYLDAARTYRDGLVRLAEARREQGLALIDLQEARGATAAALLPRR